MKRLIAAAALALGASGCGFFWETGTISATWSISVGGQEASCADVGADTVEVISRRVNGGATYHDLFDCVDYGGETSDVRSGLYDVTIRLFDKNGQQLSDDFTVELRVHTDDTANAGHFDFAFAADDSPIDPGQGGQGWFKATWIVSLNGQPTTCSVVDAVTFQIDVRIQNVEGATTKSFRFPCVDGTGTTDNVPAGSYAVEIKLLDKDDKTLNRTPIVQNPTLAANQTVNLGDFDFAFTR